jgi:hypothetical protein
LIIRLAALSRVNELSCFHSGRRNGNLSERSIGMVEVETLEQLAEVLRQLRPGEAAEMTDDVFEQFFPPGIKDDGAKGRALTFAWENGCVIDRRAEKTAVYLMRPTAA